jgi:chromosome segregation ATPase|eukprot:g3716.t1
MAASGASGGGVSGSLLRWINTYGHNVQSTEQLEDGKVFLQILNESHLRLHSTSYVEQGSGSFEKIFKVLSKALGFPADEIRNTAEKHSLSTAQLVLGAVLRSEGKQKCIQQIMVLAENDQADLMSSIQEVMQLFPEESDGLGDSSLNDSRLSAKSSIFSPAQNSVGAATPASVFSITSITSSSSSERTPLEKIQARRYKRENEALRDENDAMKKQIEELKDANADLTKQQKATLADQERVRTRWEMKFASFEDDFRESSLQQDEERNRLAQELDASKQCSKEMSETITTLRDELECSKVAAEKAGKAELALTKCKKKLEEAGDYRAQIKKMEENLKSLLARATRAEKKCDGIPSLKEQVGEYQRELTNAEVRLSELNATIKQRDSIIATLRTKNGELEKEHTENVIMKVQDIEMESNAVAADSSGGETSATMAELNPDILERIKVLEETNKELQETCDAADTDQLQELRKKCEDMTRLKSSFEEKYHEKSHDVVSLEEKLESSDSHAAQLDFQIKDLREEVQSLKANLESSTEMHMQALDDAMFEQEIEEERGLARLNDLESRYARYCDLHNTSDDVYQKKISKMKEQASALRVSLAEHETRLFTERTESEAKIASMMAEINTVRAEYEKYQGYYKKGKPAYEKLKKKLAKYENMLKRGKVALDNASKKCEIEVKARQYADDVRDAMKNENNNLKKEVTGLLEELHQPGSKMAKLRSELQTVSMLKDAIGRELEEVKGKMKALEGENRELKANSTHLRLKLERLSALDSKSPSAMRRNHSPRLVPTSPVRTPSGKENNVRLSSRRSDKVGGARRVTVGSEQKGLRRSSQENREKDVVVEGIEAQDQPSQCQQQ